MAIGSDLREIRLRQVLRLVDLSRDLERNLEDSEFRESGGEILYVLDENIFEMFVHPMRYRQAAETFYGDMWASDSDPLSEWRSFEAQAALIASEFLVSRQLPGSTDDSIVMAAQHRWELAHRVEVLADALSADLRRSPQDFAQKLQRKLNVLTTLGDRTRRVASSDNPVLERDLNNLKRALAPPDLLDRFRGARIAAEVLVEDDLTEPFDQVRRITKSAIRGRLRTLQAVFSPSPKELREIATDANIWFERLAGELQRPAHRARARARASREELGRALFNDAEAIAFARWVATRSMGPGQRMVFVTGDPIVFDAYRRWYSETPSSQQLVGEPFFMRRASQYSPIFNPHDSGGDLHQPGAEGAQTSVLFSLIQQAVEAALLPVTFVIGPPTLGGPGLVNREQLALKLVDLEQLADDPDLEDLSNRLSETWLSGHAKRIEKIRDQWQAAQRVAIGSSYDLIGARISDEQLALVASLNHGEDGGQAVLNAYVADLLDRLVEESLQLWLPLAEGFEATGTENVPRGERLSMILNFDHDSAASQEADVTPPQQVFAEAACKALAAEDIGNADRFASLALRADEAASARNLSTPGLELELRYLNAVTQRYSIATVQDQYRSGRDHQSRIGLARSLSQVKLLHARASRLIHVCLAAHFTGGDAPPDTSDEIRYLRALSERAALNLFTSVALGLARNPGQTRTDAQVFLRTAKGDLLRCLRIERTLDLDGPMLDAVRSQVLWNVAASEVIHYLLVEGGYRFDPELTPYIRQIADHLRAHPDAHPLLRAESEAFLALAGRGRREGRAGARRGAADLLLPMDRELYRRIAAERLLDG